MARGIGALKQAVKRRDGRDDEEVQRRLERTDLPWTRALTFVFKRLARHPLLLTATLLLGVGIAAAEFVSLGLILPFIDNLGAGSLSGQTKLGFLAPYFEGYSTVDQIRLIAVGLVIIQLFKGVLSYIAGRVGAYQRILLDREIREEIFDQVMAVELRFIHTEKVANLYTIMHDYPGDVAEVGKQIIKGIPRVAQFSGYLVALFLLSWKLTLLALVLAAVTTKAINFITLLVRRMARAINVYRVRLKHVSLETLNGIKVIHLFGREDHARDKFRNDLATYQDSRYQKDSVKSAVGPIYSTLMTSMFAGILVMGTYLLDTSAATWVALLTMFLFVMARLMTPASNYAKTKTTIAGKLPSMEEIIDFLERDDKPFLEDGEVPFTGLEQGVALEDVHFRYAETEPDVIKGVSFEVPKGSVVALVGSSGAGKSTTVNLLARLFDPTGGRITVDGRDLREFQVQSWRHHLAVVSQDTFLFNDSVLENIRFGRLDATDEEVYEAARLANAHGFITELPEGYGTMLGERGVRLSGGQAQRVAIARAILADPDLLLLDEATSALDTATERQVQQAIDRVSQDRTVVAIAHRLSTIRNADEIIVMEQGELVERGSHAALLSKRGHYWRYVQMQNLLDDQESDVEVPAEINGGPDLVPAELRVVLQDGGEEALVTDGNGTRRPARIVPMANGGDPQQALSEVTGDAVVLQPGRDRAMLRLGDEVHAEVPLFQERPARNGEDAGQVRCRVREVSTR